jgi:hypothetical protein
MMAAPLGSSVVETAPIEHYVGAAAVSVASVTADPE